MTIKVCVDNHFTCIFEIFQNIESRKGLSETKGQLFNSTLCTILDLYFSSRYKSTYKNRIHNFI